MKLLETLKHFMEPRFPQNASLLQNHVNCVEFTDKLIIHEIFHLQCQGISHELLCNICNISRILFWESGVF